MIANEGLSNTIAMVTAVARTPINKIFGHMLKRWCGIKEIKVSLLCEILIHFRSKKKNCCEPP